MESTSFSQRAWAFFLRLPRSACQLICWGPPASVVAASSRMSRACEWSAQDQSRCVISVARAPCGADLRKNDQIRNASRNRTPWSSMAETHRDPDARSVPSPIDGQG